MQSRREERKQKEGSRQTKKNKDGKGNREKYIDKTTYRGQMEGQMGY